MSMEPEAKVPWNLSIHAELKRQMSIYCASIGRDVSEVTEELYVELLRKEKPVRVHNIELKNLPSGIPPRFPTKRKH